MRKEVENILNHVMDNLESHDFKCRSVIDMVNENYLTFMAKMEGFKTIIDVHVFVHKGYSVWLSLDEESNNLIEKLILSGDITSIPEEHELFDIQHKELENKNSSMLVTIVCKK